MLKRSILPMPLDRRRALENHKISPSVSLTADSSLVRGSRFVWVFPQPTLPDKRRELKITQYQSLRQPDGCHLPLHKGGFFVRKTNAARKAQGVE